MNPHNQTKFDQHPSLHSLPNPQAMHTDPNQDPALSAFKTSFYDPFDIKTRKRTTRAQFQVLEESFLHDPKPTVQIRRLLAQKLDMSPRTVQIWFQNRRAKQKNKETKEGKISISYQPTQGGAQPIDTAFPPKMTKARHHPQPLDLVNSNYRQVHMPKDMPLWPPHISIIEPNALYVSATTTHSATVASYHPTPSPTSSHPVYPLNGYDRDPMRRGPVQASIATDQYATPYSYMTPENRRNSCPANLLPTFPISVPINYSNGHTPLPLPSIIEHHSSHLGDGTHAGVSEATEGHSNTVFYPVGGQYH